MKYKTLCFAAGCLAIKFPTGWNLAKGKVLC